MGVDSFIHWSFDSLANLTGNNKLKGYGLYVETTRDNYLQKVILTDFEIREEEQDLICDDKFCLQEYRKFMARNFRGYKDDCLKHIEQVELRKAQKRIYKESKPLNELTIIENEFIS